jgi:putative DNA primase/helicase
MPVQPAPPLTAPLLVWAHWYASLGWPVFPCYGKQTVRGSHGFYDATTDPDQITQWWRQWPDCNIGCPSGGAWWVLDVDARHDGPASLHDLEQQYGPLPRTVTSLTGSGGGSCHLLWKTGTLPIINKANKKRPELGSGLDVQGPGSYIILPPSIHPDTHQPYMWEADFGPDDLSPQPPPPWLEALVTQPAPADTDTLAPASAPLDGPIPEGRRESTLLTLAGAMRRTGASATAILAALTQENERCIPPLPGQCLKSPRRQVPQWAGLSMVSMAAPLRQDSSQAPGAKNCLVKRTVS